MDYHGSAQKTVVNIINIILNTQLIIALIQQKIDVSVILTTFSLFLTFFIYLSRKKKRYERLHGRALISRCLSSGTTILFTILYNTYSSIILEGNSLIKKILLLCLIEVPYFGILIISCLIDPFQASREKYAPPAIVFITYLMVCISSMITWFAKGITLKILFLGPFYVACYYIIPFILSYIMMLFLYSAEYYKPDHYNKL